MTIEQLLRVVHARLRDAADPAFRAGVRNFFTEDVDPYGVRTPDVQRIVSEIYRECKKWPTAELFCFADALWKSGKLEEGVIVSHLLKRFSRDFGAWEFRHFEAWMDRYVRNWAHCDGLSTWLIAASIANEPKLIKRLERWTRSRNRWKRRAAIVSMLQEAKLGRNTDSIFRIAERLLDDEDVMVQKGVGWVLKEAYPAQRRAVREFLEPWRSNAPRLVLRIAAEKMTPRDKRWLLGQKAPGRVTT